MDSEQFDGLVRRVGQARSRRGVLGGLGKGLGAVALGTIGLSRLEAAAAGNRRVKCPDPSPDSSYGGSCSVAPRCTADGTLLSGTCQDGALMSRLVARHRFRLRSSSTAASASATLSPTAADSHAQLLSTRCADARSSAGPKTLRVKVNMYAWRTSSVPIRLAIRVHRACPPSRARSRMRPRASTGRPPRWSRRLRWSSVLLVPRLPVGERAGHAAPPLDRARGCSRDLAAAYSTSVLDRPELGWTPAKASMRSRFGARTPTPQQRASCGEGLRPAAHRASDKASADQCLSDGLRVKEYV
jgi:hypothetical protein